MTGVEVLLALFVVLAAVFFGLMMAALADARAAEAAARVAHEQTDRHRAEADQARRDLADLRDRFNDAYRGLRGDCGCDLLPDVYAEDTQPLPAVPVIPGRIPEPTDAAVDGLVGEIYDAIYRGDIRRT